MSRPYRAGRVGAAEIRAIADRAVLFLMERTKPFAVCVDPEGRVTVEPFADAVEEDVVGVYDRTPGLIALYRTVRDDLTLTVEQRGITGARIVARDAA